MHIQIVKKIVKNILGEKLSYSIRQLIYERLPIGFDYIFLSFLNLSKYFRSVDTAPERTKPHILFVTEKWCDPNYPEFGPTNSEHNLFGSLEASELATMERFYYDEYYQLHGSFCDRALLTRCLDTKPDIIVLTAWSKRTRLGPKLETLKLIGKNINIPIVPFWFDSVQSESMEASELLLPFIRLNVVLDSTTAYLQSTNNPNKYISLWTPQDPRVFYNPDSVRDIDISFVGSINNYPDREAGIESLKSNGLEVYQSGGQREDRLSVEAYAQTYMRSKIGLNFSRGRGDRTRYANSIQSKGRMFEITLCGAALFSDDNSEVRKWFEPMVEFIPFSDEADLVKKVKHYLEHDREREKIAANGYQKAKSMYTGKIFWEKLLDKVLNS